MKSIAELKYFESALGDNPTLIAGAIFTGLNDVPAGDGSDDRDGRQITQTKAMYRGVITLPSTSDPTQTHDIVRIIMVMDQAPAIDPIVSGAGGILETASVQGFKEMGESSRFKTVMDKTYEIRSTVGAYDGTNDQFGETSIFVEFYKDMNEKVIFDSSGDPSTNAMTGLIISENGLATVSGITRIRFLDI